MDEWERESVGCLSGRRLELEVGLWEDNALVLDWVVEPCAPSALEELCQVRVKSGISEKSSSGEKPPSIPIWDMAAPRNVWSLCDCVPPPDGTCGLQKSIGISFNKSNMVSSMTMKSSMIEEPLLCGATLASSCVGGAESPAADVLDKEGCILRRI